MSKIKQKITKFLETHSYGRPIEINLIKENLKKESDEDLDVETIKLALRTYRVVGRVAEYETQNNIYYTIDRKVPYKKIQNRSETLEKIGSKDPDARKVLEESILNGDVPNQILDNFLRSWGKAQIILRKEKN